MSLKQFKRLRKSSRTKRESTRDKKVPLLVVLLGAIFALVASHLHFVRPFFSAEYERIALSDVQDFVASKNETRLSRQGESKSIPSQLQKESKNALPTSATESNKQFSLGNDGCDITPSRNVKQTASKVLDTMVNTTHLGSKLQLPLEGPPYYLIQHGVPRSGSTFQRELLRAILDLKSSSLSRANAETLSKAPIERGELRTLIKANRENGRPVTAVNYQGALMKKVIENGFTQKEHRHEWIEKSICEFHQKLEKPVALFVSVPGIEDAQDQNDDDRLKAILKPLFVTYDPGFIVHIQELKGKEFRNCSLCQIKDYYQPIFGLTEDQVRILEDYMKTYQILRRCCGFQMSKYQFLRVQGCNTTEYQDDPGYPWCEKHDLVEVEKQHASFLLEHGLRPPAESLWSKPGDCARDDRLMRAKDNPSFRSWDGTCNLNGVEWNLGPPFKTRESPLQ